MRIADYFGVSVSYLLGVSDDPDPIALVDPSKKEPPMMEWLTKLDDMTPDELSEKLGVPIRAGRNNGGDFIREMLGIE
jgi:hypothetical protein